MAELRCEHKLLGILLRPAQGGVVELKCSSKFCGAGAGTVVLHRFSTDDGHLIDTRRYRDTPPVERTGDARSGHRTSLRSA